MENRRSWLIIALLALSLALNISATTTLRAIRRELWAVESFSRTDLGNLRDRLDHVSGQLWRLEQAGSWVQELREHFPTDNLGPGDPIPVSIAWMFRELPQDAHVVLAYRPSEEKEWREAEATLRGGLEYEATVNLDPERNWAYCILARYRGTTRSSDIRQLDLRDKFAASGDVFAEINRRQEDGPQVRLEISLRQRPKPLLAWRRIAAAELLPRTADGRELPAVSFAASGADGIWTLSCTLPKEAGEATVRVHFADGTTAEGLLPLDGRPTPAPLIAPDLGNP